MSGREVSIKIRYHFFFPIVTKDCIIESVNKAKETKKKIEYAIST